MSTDSTAEAASMRDTLGQIYDQMQGQLENDPARESGESETEQEAPESLELDLAEDIEDEPVESAPSNAPAHWSDQRKAQFDALTEFGEQGAAIQQTWLDREAEYERGIQAKAQEAAQYRQAIDPIRQYLQMSGMDESAWIRQMAGYTMALQNDPLSVIQQVARQYGVDLGALNQETDEFVDPQVQKLQEQLQTIQQQLQQSQQTAQQERTTATERAIQSFRDEKTPDGKLANPHFDAVYQDMVVLATGYAQSGQQPPQLPELYKKALKLHPELTDTSQASQADKAQRAKRARSAAASAKSSVASVGETKPKTLKDELRATWDKLEGAN